MNNWTFGGQRGGVAKTRGSWLVWAAALGALSIGSGCDTEESTATEQLVEISSQGAALSATENTERALNGLVGAGSFLVESQSIAETLSSVGSGEESCDYVYPPCPLDGPCPEPEAICEADGTVTEDALAEAKAELEEGIAELVNVLRTEVLIEDNLEEETETSVTYLLGPNLLCSSDDISTISTNSIDDVAEESTEEAPAELDPECVAEVERVQPRLKLTSPSEGDVDIAVLFGAERLQPFVLELHQESLGVRADLAELLAVSELFEEDEDFSRVKTLQGVVQLQLVKNGNKDYSLQYNLLEDFVLAVEDDDGEELSLSMGASSPAMEMRVDGDSETVSMSYDVGSVELLAPLAMLADMTGDDDSVSGSDDYLTAEDSPAEEEPEVQYTGTINALLAGFSGTVSYTAESDSIELSNIGLGDSQSTVKHDGNTILSADLNPDDGRHFDVSAMANDEEGATLTFSPTFDLSLAFAFKHIADQIEDLPSFMLEDTVRIWFEGEEPTLSVEANQTRMVSGSMHMSSSAVPEATIEVAEGMCMVGEAEEPTPSDELFEEPVEESSGHELLSELNVGACQ